MCIHDSLCKIISKDDLDIFIEFTTAHKDHNFENCDKCNNVKDLDLFCLFRAVDIRAVNILDYLLSLNPNNIHRTKHGVTLLHHAAEKNCEVVVGLLLKHRADIHIEAGYKRTPLHYAAIISKNEKIIKLLLDYGADPNKQDLFGDTPLYQTAHHHRPEMLKVLLEQGADPNIKNNAGLSPIHMVTKNCYMDMLELLLKYNADVNAVGLDGKALLHIAVKKNKIELMNLLLSYKPAIDKKDNDGKTPLHLAVEHNNKEMVKLLVHNGAKLDKKDKKKRTPLYLAVELCCEKIIEFLLTQGANPNKKNQAGRTPLHKASENDDKKTVNLLLANQSTHKTNINEQDNDGLTALNVALDYGRGGIAKLLLNNGADVNIVDKNGLTILHHAATTEWPKIVKLLLDHGADPNKEDSNQWTPLHHVIEFGSSRMIFEILYEKIDEKYKLDPVISKYVGKNNKACIKIHTELIMQSYEFDTESLFSQDYICRDLLFLILRMAKKEKFLAKCNQLMKY